MKKKNTKVKILLSSIAIFIAFCCCLPLTIGAVDSTLREVGFLPTRTPTMTPTMTLTPSPTLSPTPTMTPSKTPSPTVTLTLAATLPDDRNVNCVPRTNVQRVGMVINVIDGDTITVRTDEKDWVVNYAGIDAPELENYYGEPARQENYNLVGWKTVSFIEIEHKNSSDDEVWAFVFVDDLFVNTELIRLGAVSTDVGEADDCEKNFVEVEASARNRYIGMWRSTTTPAPKVQENNSSSESTHPAGATALCKDGTYSYSQSRRGTCSWHGGVALWLSP